MPENEKIQPEWKRFEDIKETLGLLPAGEAYPQRTMLLLSELLGSKPESLREEIKRSDKAERKLNLRELLRTLSAEGLLTRRFYAVNRRVKLYDEEIKVLSLIIEAAAMEKDFVSMVVAEGMVQQQLLSQIRSLSMKLKTDLLEKIFITIETRKVPLEQRKAQKKVIEDEIAEVSRDKIRTNFVKFFEDMDFVAQKTELPATDSQNTENNTRNPFARGMDWLAEKEDEWPGASSSPVCTTLVEHKDNASSPIGDTFDDADALAKGPSSPDKRKGYTEYPIWQPVPDDVRVSGNPFYTRRGPGVIECIPGKDTA
ncbi:MAG: hypothetical protein KAR31_00025, partial [Candidatus Omnitrophica bacterium]|nr:hypothetical protein [Candidatus Omnitrophota bacterium]